MIEEIVGEIEDEFDVPEQQIEQTGDDSYRVDGMFPIEEFNEHFGADLPDEDFHTVAGFVFGQLGRAPEPGDDVSYDGMRFDVDGVEGTRIDRADGDLPAARARRGAAGDRRGRVAAVASGGRSGGPSSVVFASVVVVKKVVEGEVPGVVVVVGRASWSSGRGGRGRRSRRRHGLDDLAADDLVERVDDGAVAARAAVDRVRLAVVGHDRVAAGAALQLVLAAPPIRTSLPGPPSSRSSPAPPSRVSLPRRPSTVSSPPPPAR